MEFTRATPEEVNFTHRQGEVTTTLKYLREVFGNPCEEQPSEWDKVGYEWRFKFEDGIIATIYDWKRYTKEPLKENEVFTFNIGGHKPESVLRIRETLGYGHGIPAEIL
jgi:hypothetical protein